MVKSMVYVLNIIVLASILTPNIMAQEKVNAKEIMDKWDNRTIPIDLTSKTTMKLIDKKGKARVRVLNVYRMSDNKQIMWFHQPANVKGSSFLRLSYDDKDDDMWIYLPSFGKVRRIASHAKKGSFMGSDFTFEDMGDRKLNEYSYKYVKSDKYNDKLCWVIESTPKKDVATDYSKIISWIWQDDYLDVKEEYYDKRGKIKKRKTLEVKKVGKYWVPNLIVMENLKSQHKTEMIIENIKVDTEMDDKIFNSNYLKRIR